MEDQKSSEEKDVSQERGVLHRWQGYSSTVKPVTVLLPYPVLQTALGISHGVLLTQGGLVYSFGELPWKRDLKSQVMDPILESALTGQCVVRVSAGSYHCGAITEDRMVHMWGENSYGQCGVTSCSLVSDPTPVNIVDDETVPPDQVWIQDIACGAQHTLALSGSHEVWAWGNGCQLGLVTNAFPVIRPQKVEHLSGRYVVQIACGEFHSLALVLSQHFSQLVQQTQDKCGQCKQPLYTMIDKDDHVIISDTHYCPLGVELTDTKQSEKSNMGSSAITLKMENSSSDLQNCPEDLTYIDGSYKDNTAREEKAVHHEPFLLPTTDSVKAQHLRRTKSNPYPNEEDLKDYLRRISDQSVLEQFEAERVSRKGSRPPSRQPSLKDSYSKHIFPSLERGAIESKLSNYVQDTDSMFQSPIDQSILPVDDPVHDDSSEDSGINRVSPSDILTSTSFEEASDEGLDIVGNLECLDESLEAKKSTSLTDIRVEDVGCSRRRSLPGLLSPVFPSSLHRINYTKSRGVSTTSSVISEKENLLPTLFTEVWSWGRGQEGQLGHGDMLPRLQPLCIKSLNSKEVVKIVAGANHSLALTADCQAYSWGCNQFGQLGHRNSNIVPQIIKLSDGIRVWDAAGGMIHTVLLADGDCFQPILYYSGEQVQANSLTGTYTQTPVLLPFCMNIGYVSSVFAGGLNCMALADQNMMGFIGTLHELASAERTFYCVLRRVKDQILSPLLARDSLRTYLGRKITLFQTLAGQFCHLCHLIGQHATSVTRFLQHSRNVQTLTVLKSAALLVDTYKEYSDPVGNFLVMGGFQALVKPAQECFGKKLELVQNILELKEKNLLPSDLLLNLFYMPLWHLQDYSRLLLKLTACFDVNSVEYRMLQDGSLQYEVLAQVLSKQRTEAERTYTFWKNFSGKGSESLRKPSRRLVCESGNKGLSLQNAGRFSVHWFILFNDALVHAQGNIPAKKFFSSYLIYPLATLWVEPVSDENAGLLGLKLTTPEGNFTLVASSPLEKGKWLRAINQAVDEVLGVNVDKQGFSLNGSQLAEPPISRTASYTFTKEGRLSGAVYSGRWLSGKPHGKGTLKWPDGRVYCGTFKNGLEDGFGDYMMPNQTYSTYDRYKGHWKEGKMQGFGTYRYASGEVYEGSFQENLRHGHGMLSSGRKASSSSTNISVFVGQWIHDKKTGYGIFEDITKGEKYMGMWQEDQRQGSGVVVTQSGLYYEGELNNNKMMGSGLLLCDDDTAFEGEFSDDWMLNGKGVLSMSNGDSFEGVFMGEWGSELKTTGTFKKTCPYETEKKDNKTITVGPRAVPAEQKWKVVFEECWTRLGCDAPGLGQSERAWENIAVILTTGRREQIVSSEALSRSQCKMLESLEVIPQHVGPVTAESYDNIRRYLIKACDTPLHPLGWLLETLVTVYRMTYVGVGSNRRLLQQAVEEIKSYLQRIFQLIRFLFPGLPEDGGFILESSEKRKKKDSLSSMTYSETTHQGWTVSSSSLLLPLLLPRLYPPLFTLYTLEREREEEVYADCVLHLNRQPDLSLLTFLGVPQKYWPVSISVLGEKKEVLPTTKDACFATAVETLQQISTRFTPADKLQVIQLTFEEITQEVQVMLGQDFLWCMDDLFPVFLYVVLRARIKNLGSEVSLIEDLMDPAVQHGVMGLMFTTLKACYVQIQLEKAAGI